MSTRLHSSALKAWVRMSTPRHSSAMVILAGVGLWAALAAADVRVCNRFSLPVYVAIGYATTSDVKTEGWWPVEPDACRVVDRRPVDGPYYIHAHTQWLEDDDGPRRRYQWGKGTTLAVDRRPFAFARADQIAARDEVEEFSDVSDGDARHITYTILNARYSEITQDH